MSSRIVKAAGSEAWLTRGQRACISNIMADDLIDSRGRFWSAEIPVPERHFAPDKSVTGRLRLRADGRAQLDLDATIDLTGSSKDAVDRIFTKGDVEGAICGFLIDANKHVRLTDLSGGGGTLGGMGPIFEGLIAYRCLVAREPFKPGAEPHFRWLDLPLDGFEEWLERGHITVTSGPRRIKADYAAQRAPQRWQAGDMPIELHRYLDGTGGTDVTEIAWRERSYLRLGAPKADLTLEQAIKLAMRIEELLTLMADHDRRLDFGTLRRSRSARPVQFYYARGTRDDPEKLRWDKAWARLDACSNAFGDIVAAWRTAYETYGPGFHLYLGNRRGQALYPEHRFASLIWGLEALHRAMVPPKDNAALLAKVERILAAIETDRDRKWAERVLPQTSEPPLADRLLDLFSRIDLGIASKELAAFARRCADRRNDVSHFGGRREPGGYDAFLQDIMDLSRAIDLLYHALILQIIGVPEALVRRRFIGGPHSHPACAVLAHVGLHVPEPRPQPLPS